MQIYRSFCIFYIRFPVSLLSDLMGIIPRDILWYLLDFLSLKNSKKFSSDFPGNKWFSNNSIFEKCDSFTPFRILYLSPFLKITIDIVVNL